MNKKRVWVVTYIDDDGTPVVTVFSNESAAKKCYQLFLNAYNKVSIDKCQVFTAIMYEEKPPREKET